MTLPQTS